MFFSNSVCHTPDPSCHARLTYYTVFFFSWHTPTIFCCCHNRKHIKMLFCKHSVWSLLNSLEPWISLAVFIGVNVDRSLNLTVSNDKLNTVLYKVERNGIEKKGFFNLHLEGTQHSYKGWCSKISLHTFQRVFIVIVAVIAAVTMFLATRWNMDSSKKNKGGCYRLPPRWQF